MQLHVRQAIQTTLWRHQLLRFLLVGGLNTLFSYAIYAGLIFLGAHFSLANLAALVLGILFSFKTQGRLVFRNPDNRLIGRFFLAWSLIYLATIGVIGLGIRLGLSSYIAGLAALPFSTVLSYGAQKYFVFRRQAISLEPHQGMENLK